MKSLKDLFPQFGEIYQGFQPDQVLEYQTQRLNSGIQWERLRARLSHRQDGSFGICLNALRFPAKDLRPFITQFQQKGVERLLKDESLQANIAHAYWQTCWAGGALRLEHGDTEPIAFFPAHRRLPSNQPVCSAKILNIDNGRLIVGRESCTWYQLQQAVREGKLVWQDGRFDGRVGFEILALLNNRAFIDRFIGANKNLKGTIQINKLIPVSGSHLITRLLKGGIANYAPRRDWLAAKVLAATNGGFFLNFPEEYRNLWSAMNDPVGLLIDRGQLFQLPLVRRGSLLVDAQGHAIIARTSMEDVAFRLPWEKNWHSTNGENRFYIDEAGRIGRDWLIFTPAFAAEGPPDLQKSPKGRVVDLVTLFGEIVEVQKGGGSEIPASGIVISIPEKDLPFLPLKELLPQFGHFIRFRFLHQKFDLQNIKTAVSAGPVLLQSGEILPKTYFHGGEGNEQFFSAKQDGHRWAKSGIAPTRFPLDTTDTRAPRTVIGQYSRDQLILLVIDGRFISHSLGATLQEAAAILARLNCSAALNLDGGGSSLLYLPGMGKKVPPLAPAVKPGIVNLPSDVDHQERLMPVPLFILDSIKNQEPEKSGGPIQ